MAYHICQDAADENKLQLISVFFICIAAEIIVADGSIVILQIIGIYSKEHRLAAGGFRQGCVAFIGGQNQQIILFQKDRFSSIVYLDFSFQNKHDFDIVVPVVAIRPEIIDVLFCVQ